MPVVLHAFSVVHVYLGSCCHLHRHHEYCAKGELLQLQLKSRAADHPTEGLLQQNCWQHVVSETCSVCWHQAHRLRRVRRWMNKQHVMICLLRLGQKRQCHYRQLQLRPLRFLRVPFWQGWHPFLQRLEVCTNGIWSESLRKMCEL